MNESQWWKQTIQPTIRESHTNTTVHWYGADSEQTFDSNEFNPSSRGYNKESITYTLNEFGYRSDPFTPTDKFKILVCGDSYTFGIGVRHEDSWPGRVKTATPNSTLYNLSLGGSSSDYVVRSLYTSLPVLNPDCCLIVWPFKNRFELFNDTGEIVFSDDQNNAVLCNQTLQQYAFSKNYKFAQMICDYHQVPLYSTLHNVNFDELSIDDYGRDWHPGPRIHEATATYFIDRISKQLTDHHINIFDDHSS